jgi:hypothetical protein
VVDNLSTHKHPAVRAWLARHPRVRLHLTPTSGSWLNLVEALFSIITRQALRRGNFPTVADVIAAIERFLAASNDRCRPFTWTKDPDTVIAKATDGAARHKQRQLRSTRSGPHRQRGSGPLQRLNLRFLIDTEHHRLLRRMQVPPDDVADLSLQRRVGGELERLRPPGCTPKRCQIRATVACEIGVPSPAMAAARRREDQCVAPNRGRRLGQGQLQHPIPQLLGQLRRLARPRQVLQAGQPRSA